MPRTVVQPRRSSLASIAVVSGGISILWIWMAIAAFMEDVVSRWIILPVSLVGALVFGGVCLWAIKRRRVEEPAVIIDEVGIYDNVSVAHGGRVKWRDMERIWVAGPSWMPFLCILPDKMLPYLEEQGDFKGAIMRLNRSVVGAPVIIPIAILDLPQEDIWNRIVQLGGGTHPAIVHELGSWLVNR